MPGLYHLPQGAEPLLLQPLSLTFQFDLSQDAIFHALPPCPSSSHRLTSAPHLPSLPVLPLTLSSCPWPVLSLKQLLFPSEEDSGAGPPREGDGVPGGGPPSPTQTQTQEIQEKLLSLEETIKQLEVVAWGEGQSGGRMGLGGGTSLIDDLCAPVPPNQEVEEEFCRLRLLLSQLGENPVPQPGCT